MANLSLANAAVVTSAPESVGLRQRIVEKNPIMDFINWVPIAAGQSAHAWFEETSQGTAAFRGINGSYTANHGQLRRYSDPVAILGGEIAIDIAMERLYGNESPEGGLFMTQANMKARAAMRKLEETIFEGDVGVDPNAFDGLRARTVERGMEFDATGSGTDRAEMTLAMLDEVQDAVIGGNRVWHLSQWNKRKINALMRAAGQAREPVGGEFGRQYDTYAGIPLVVQERENDMTTILGFDEDPGDGGDDASSMYLVNWGGPEDDHAIVGLMGAGGAFDLYSLNGDGGTQDAPLNKGRLEVYPGIASHGNRGAARLKGLGQI